MRYVRISLILAGVALIAAPEDAVAQTVYQKETVHETHSTAPATSTTTVVVPPAAPAYGYAPYTAAPLLSPYGAVGQTRRVSRRTSRRTSRRHSY